jgi:hypothetical protein
LLLLVLMASLLMLLLSSLSLLLLVAAGVGGVDVHSSLPMHLEHRGRLNLSTS